MSETGIELILSQMAELRRQVGQMIISGPVKEVLGDKIRVITGKDANGEDVLSPWLDTANHRGGATERRFFKQGQNVTMMNAHGDFMQTVVVPYAPNKDFKAPDHANESGQDEETYQLEDLRVKKTKDGYDIWLGAKDSATHKIRLNKNGGITARIGTDKRMMVNSQGAKLKAGGNFVVVTPSQIVSSVEIVIGSDPMTDDND